MAEGFRVFQHQYQPHHHHHHHHTTAASAASVATAGGGGGGGGVELGVGEGIGRHPKLYDHAIPAKSDEITPVIVPSSAVSSVPGEPSHSGLACQATAAVAAAAATAAANAAVSAGMMDVPFAWNEDLADLVAKLFGTSATAGEAGPPAAPAPAPHHHHHHHHHQQQQQQQQQHHSMLKTKREDYEDGARATTGKKQRSHQTCLGCGLSEAGPEPLGCLGTSLATTEASTAGGGGGSADEEKPAKKTRTKGRGLCDRFEDVPSTVVKVYGHNIWVTPHDLRAQALRIMYMMWGVVGHDKLRRPDDEKTVAWTVLVFATPEGRERWLQHYGPGQGSKKHSYELMSWQSWVSVHGADWHSSRADLPVMSASLDGIVLWRSCRVHRVKSGEGRYIGKMCMLSRFRGGAVRDVHDKCLDCYPHQRRRGAAGGSGSSSGRSPQQSPGAGARSPGMDARASSSPASGPSYSSHSGNAGSRSDGSGSSSHPHPRSGGLAFPPYSSRAPIPASTEAAAAMAVSTMASLPPAGAVGGVEPYTGSGAVSSSAGVDYTAPGGFAGGADILDGSVHAQTSDSAHFGGLSTDPLPEVLDPTLSYLFDQDDTGFLPTETHPGHPQATSEYTMPVIRRHSLPDDRLVLEDFWSGTQSTENASNIPASRVSRPVVDSIAAAAATAAAAAAAAAGGDSPAPAVAAASTSAGAPSSSPVSSTSSVSATASSSASSGPAAAASPDRVVAGASVKDQEEPAASPALQECLGYTLAAGRVVEDDDGTSHSQMCPVSAVGPGGRPGATAPSASCTRHSRGAVVPVDRLLFILMSPEAIQENMAEAHDASTIKSPLALAGVIQRTLPSVSGIHFLPSSQGVTALVVVDSDRDAEDAIMQSTPDEGFAVMPVQLHSVPGKEVVDDSTVEDGAKLVWYPCHAASGFAGHTPSVCNRLGVGMCPMMAPDKSLVAKDGNMCIALPTPSFMYAKGDSPSSCDHCTSRVKPAETKPSGPEALAARLAALRMG